MQGPETLERRLENALQHKNEIRQECARAREQRMLLERKLERAKEDAEEALNTLRHATHHNWSPKVEWAETLLARIVSDDG